MKSLPEQLRATALELREAVDARRAGFATSPVWDNNYQEQVSYLLKEAADALEEAQIKKEQG